MQVTDSYNEFRRFLRGKGLYLKDLDIDRGLVESAEFFKEMRASQVEGDSLVFYCDYFNRGDGGAFEIGTLRCFQFKGGDGTANTKRLRLTFKYSQSDVMLKGNLDPGANQVARFCHSPVDTESLLEFARSTQAYQAVLALELKSVNLKLEDGWGAFG